MDQIAIITLRKARVRGEGEKKREFILSSRLLLVLGPKIHLYYSIIYYIEWLGPSSLIQKTINFQRS